MCGDSGYLTADGRRPGVLLADDHRLVAEGIARLLVAEYELLEVLGNGQSLVEAAIRHRPDLILADISMPGTNGIQAMKQIHAAGVNSPVVFVTVHDEPAMVREALSAGARGYILKAAAGEELLYALREVIDGRVYASPELRGADARANVPSLTNQQKNILGLLSTGLRSKQIAAELGMSIRTVDTHRYAIMQAFGVHNSISLLREARRLGVFGVC